MNEGWNQSSYSVKENLCNEAMKYCRPLLLIDLKEDRVHDSGSGIIVQFETEQYFITCHHVWFGMLEKVDDPRFLFLINLKQENGYFEHTKLEFWDADKDRDTCILKIPEGIHIDRKYVWNPDVWPPPRPKTDDFAATIGYPLSNITLETSAKNIRFSANIFLETITSVSDRSISFQSGTSGRTVEIHQDGLSVENLTFGGMSGGPMFIVHGDELHYVGNFYEGDPENRLEYPFFHTHASIIKADGKIDRGLL